jgi:glycosyltransferase involved in cell wall biosynthesis
MRILMLISQLGWGGAEGAFIRLARELALRHEVAIALFTEVARYGRSSYSATEPVTDFEIHYLDDFNRPRRLKRWRDRIFRLHKLKRQFGADATISFLTGPNLLNVLTPGPGVAIISIRGSRRFDENSSWLMRQIYRWLFDPLSLSLADAVVCVAEGLTREVAGNRPPSKFRTISGYVQPERLIEVAAAPIEPELEKLDRYPLVVAAGRLSPEKGFQHLIRVFAATRSAMSEAKLLLIGDGPFRAELERMCRTHGLSHGGADEDLSRLAVIFLGFRANPHRYFRLGRVFALPSDPGGFPNILIEALAAGVPVVAGDVPWGTREVLGIAADPDNRPYPRSDPLDTGLGMLMPRIDSRQFEQTWVEVLTRQLAETDFAVQARERRQARVRQLSCAAAAAKWSELLDELQVTAHPHPSCRQFLV